MQVERKGTTLHGRFDLLFEFRSSRSTPFREETEAGRNRHFVALQDITSKFHT